MSFSPSKTAYTITYAALISHLQGMADSIRQSLADEQCPLDRAQAHRVLEVLLMGIRMAEDCMAEAEDINALVDTRINEIQEERAPFIPVPASLVIDEEDVEMWEDVDNDDEEEGVAQHQAPGLPAGRGTLADASPARSDESSLPDLSRFRSSTSHTPRHSPISRHSPTAHPSRRPLDPLTPQSLRTQQWTDIRTLIIEDLKSYTASHAIDTEHGLDYHETIRALREAYEVAEQEPSNIEPEQLWYSVQDEIQGFKDIADAQREAREPVSVVGSDDEEEASGGICIETPYNSSGRPIGESWHPFIPVSPLPPNLQPAPAPSPSRAYDFEALDDVPSDPQSQQLVRRAIERTLNEVLNASDSPELQDVAQAYWDHVEKEMPSPALGGVGLLHEERRNSTYERSAMVR